MIKLVVSDILCHVSIQTDKERVGSVNVIGAPTDFLSLVLLGISHFDTLTLSLARMLKTFVEMPCQSLLL